MALYNEVRPRTLAQVKGQDTVIKIIKDSIARNSLPNAALFVGTRGTGKTSVARILARMMNCENPAEDHSPCCTCDTCKAIMNGTHLDVIELDAASNNGVDDVRHIIELVEYKPISKKKVVILDEVHMLSNGAFNALLKVLEEPPADVMFILCTTELHKVPATIVSRCRKFQFNSMEADTIISKLTEINEQYGKTAEPAALKLVAKAAKGSMRDAESIYESFLNSDGPVTVETVRKHLGLSSEDQVLAILDSIKLGDPMLAKNVVEECESRGASLVCLLEDCFEYLMDIIAIRLSGDVSDNEKLGEYAFAFTENRLFEIADAIKGAYEKKSGNLSLAIQAAVIGLVCRESFITKLESRVTELENQVKELSERPVVMAAAAVEAPKPVEKPTPIYQSQEELDDALAYEYARTMDECEMVEEVPTPVINEEPITVPRPQETPVPCEPTPTATTPTVNQDALAALVAAGFTVVGGTADPFADDLSFETPESVPVTEATPVAPPKAEEQKKEETKSVEKHSEASEKTATDFLDDFARLFGL